MPQSPAADNTNSLTSEYRGNCGGRETQPLNIAAGSARPQVRNDRVAGRRRAPRRRSIELQCLADDVVEVGLVEQSADIDRTRTIGGDAQLCAGVPL